MNNKAISLSKGKLSFRMGLYDVLVCLLVITSLAFYDMKVIFLGTQVITFAFAALQFLYRGIRRITRNYLIWLAIFTLYGSLSILWASERNSTAFSVTLSVVQVGLVCYCIIDYCVDKIRFMRIIKSFLIACMVLCIRFLISVPVSLWGQGDRFSKDTIFGSNTPAMVLAYGAILLLWLLLEKNTKARKALPIFGIVAFMFVSMMAGTRKGIIAFLIAFVIISLMRAKNPLSLIKKLIVITVVLIGVYIAIMKIPVLYGSIGYRIESMIAGFLGEETDRSAVGRSVLREDAWKTFLKNPIFGVGQDGYRYVSVYNSYYSHNNYVELLANLGIFGFGIFYSLYVWLFVKCKRAGRFAILSACILIITLVMDYAQVGYADETTYVLLGIAFAALGYSKEKETCNA